MSHDHKKPLMPQQNSDLLTSKNSLRYSGFRRFAASLLLTSLGGQLLQIAILWQVYEITGSALLLGLSGLARAAPHMILSMVGGVLADRLNRVYLVQAGQLGNATVLSVLAFLVLTDSIVVWHLYAVTLLNSAFSAITQPSRTALIPSLVPHRNLVNAIALNATIGQISHIAGPALAGFTIAYIGLESTYFISGVLYLSSMIAIVGIRVASTSTTNLESPWHNFTQGMAFVWSKPVIISLLLIDVGATTLGSYRALLPIFAEALDAGAAGFGILSAAPGIGSLIGAGVMLSLGDMKYKGLYTVFGVLFYSVALVMLAISPSFFVAILATGLLGMANTVQVIPRNSVILGISPAQLRGRVEAFRSMVAGGAPSLGYTLSGGIAAMLGAPIAVLIGAVSCGLLVTMIGVSHSTLRDKDLGAPSVTES
tara:strand:- start:11159 stop:12433 length:1275 start_codon:yes stop_codon:yes gene_type:complete